ncbi:unnamed protein product [Ilex paraguariensis]|uniref:Uncharacterized protein n=1 Tax=Ilex paraguariensis TaxID=185542 RepID=A0ABC8T585_9AQUA
MEREKLNAVKKVLTTDQTAHFRQLIVDKLVELEPQLLACYDEFLDINGHTLAWIWAIDENMLQLCSSLGIGGPAVQALQKHIQFIQALPWENIRSLFQKIDIDGNQNPVEDIEIPSVSSLQKTVGIRNLVAYEALSMPVGSTLELAEYVDLMCGIVDTVEDVKILREERIIGGDLSDDQIADIFHGIKKSTSMNRKSKLTRAIDEVNRQHENRTRMKACRFIMKYLNSSWNFVQTSWKVLSLSSIIVAILLQTLQAFCEIYGCSNRWVGKSKGKNLNFPGMSSFVM